MSSTIAMAAAQRVAARRLLGLGVAEVRDGPIALELRDDTALRGDDGGYPVLVRVEDLVPVLGIERRCQVRRADEVREHHRQLASLGGVGRGRRWDWRFRLVRCGATPEPQPSSHGRKSTSAQARGARVPDERSRRTVSVLAWASRSETHRNGPCREPAGVPRLTSHASERGSSRRGTAAGDRRRAGRGGTRGRQRIRAGHHDHATAPVTTTTLAPTTTTLAPTTTTLAPTTTTTLPATTTTRAHASTTTSHPTTTTTAAGTSSSSATWGWVLLAVVLVLAAVLVGLLIARSRRQGRAAQWQRAALPAVGAAELARDLVLSLSETDDQQRRANVGVQVDEAVGGLERVAASAPDEATQALCVRAGESLRGLAFVVEADHLLRSGGQHPTGEQLAAADAARRNRGAELAAALGELKVALAPPS